MYENIPVLLKDLPTSVRGFICLGEDYEPIIIINSRLSAEEQQKVYVHEVIHYLLGDMDNESFHEYGDAI